jgi:hypothetical protein
MKLANFRRIVAGHLAAALLALAFAVAAAPADKDDKDDKKPAEAAPPSRVSRNAEGETVVKLDEKTQKLIELKTEALVAVDYGSSVVAYGQILDPAPLALLDSELRAGAFSLEISKAQEARARLLFGENDLVSRKALETAQEQLATDEIRLQSSRRRLELEWGPLVSRLDATNRAQLLEKLIAREALLARADLPLVDLPKEKVAAAWFTPLGSDDPLRANTFAPAPSLDPKTQQLGYFLLVTNLEQHAAPAPGSAITARLSIESKAKSGVVIPRSAVIRANSAAWVYTRTGAENFTRRPLALNLSVPAGWFVESGFKPDEQVVTQGSALLLSEELKASGVGGGD